MSEDLNVTDQQSLNDVARITRGLPRWSKLWTPRDRELLEMRMGIAGACTHPSPTNRK